MPAPLLATKLALPRSPRRNVPRPRLIERLDRGLDGGARLTLVSAPAGSGKTTLVADWAAGCGRPVAWLSLDAADSDPGRFVSYLVAALGVVAPGAGMGAVAVMGAAQPAALEPAMTALVNDLAEHPEPILLVLDDHHVLEAPGIDAGIAFLVEHLPPTLHLVIATREDPALPLARLRARGELSEVRGADLRFTADEAASFLRDVMGLDLTPAAIAALEARTEGWIAGLQLAALSLQGRADVDGFIASFTGSHQFVLDYLVEEVLQRQPADVQAFLLRTCILERLCGPLCDAVLGDDPGDGQATLERLARANLFVIALDEERRWFRYHHLFAELLRQRRTHLPVTPAALDADHLRASEWYEATGFDVEAFEHAAAGHDVDRAERLIEGGGVPLHHRGALAPMTGWLRTLPDETLDARPSLRVTYASVLLGSGEVRGVERQLEAAEDALANLEPSAFNRDLGGRIATVRALLAMSRGDPGAIVTQSRLALELLDPGNMAFRAAPLMTLGYACQLEGNRPDARAAYEDVVAISRATGNTVDEVLGSIGLGVLDASDNQLAAAAAHFRRAIDLSTGLPLPVVCEAHLGLARLHYEWNELSTARDVAEEALRLAGRLPSTDRGVACDVVLARIAMADGDVAEAIARLDVADRAARRGGFALQVPDIAAERIRIQLHQGDLAGAATIAEVAVSAVSAVPAEPPAADAADPPAAAAADPDQLALSLARIRLAAGAPEAALSLLAPFRRRAEKRAWPDQRLRAMTLEAIALAELGDRDAAAARLVEVLSVAAPEGFLRLFVDEGPRMAALLLAVKPRGLHRAYVDRLLGVFASEQPGGAARASVHTLDAGLAEPLSPREVEVLVLIAAGLGNQAIADRLYLSLHTVKSHARAIYGKLGVESRTQAVARARDLGLIPTDDRTAS